MFGYLFECIHMFNDRMNNWRILKWWYLEIVSFYGRSCKSLMSVHLAHTCYLTKYVDFERANHYWDPPISIKITPRLKERLYLVLIHHAYRRHSSRYLLLLHAFLVRLCLLLSTSRSLHLWLTTQNRQKTSPLCSALHLLSVH